MASLKQNIKSVLTEVEKFLVETLKGVKLDKSKNDGKERLLEKVRQLLDEILGQSSSSAQLDGSNASGGSFGVSGGGSSDSSNSNMQATPEDSSYADDISKIAANELKDIYQAGLLDKKKKTGLKSWEQMYCVVSKSIFYIYKKQTDSKQKEAFCLTGYEFQEAPSLEKDASKKEVCFQMTKAGSHAFQFRASSKEAMLIWKESILKGIHTGAEAQILAEPGEMYEDVGQNQDLPPPPSPEEMGLDDPDDIYEECGDAVASAKPPAPPKSEPPPPPRKSEPLPPPPKAGQGEMEELYDEGFSAITEEEVKEAKKATESKAPELPLSLPPGRGRREPPPTPPSSELPPRPPPKAELPPIPAPTPPPPLPDRKGGPLDPRSPPPPPPIPSNPPPPRGALRVPHLRTPFMDRDEDFENLFYSKWDCVKDSSKELDFKKGDIIHVLSKDFDSDSWWVGELEGHIGLVPKDFLCPAFQLVS